MYNFDVLAIAQVVCSVALRKYEIGPFERKHKLDKTL